MKQQTKLTPKQEQLAEQLTQAQVKEFSTAEAALRDDAAQIIVPPEIAERLKKSAAGIAPPAARPWWRRIFNQ